MSELSKLVGTGKDITLGEITIHIKPLTVNSIPILMSMSSENPKEQAEAMNEIIRTTLKEAVPDATDEEIKNIGVEYMMPLMEAIMSINKLDNIDSDKARLIEKMKGQNERTPKPGA